MLPAEYATELTEEERAERHTPPPPSKMPRRPSLKGMSSLGKLGAAETPLSPDDVSVRTYSESECDSSAKLNRRMSWTDDHGEDLTTVRRRRCPPPAAAAAAAAAAIRRRPAGRRVPTVPPPRAAQVHHVHDTHYRRSWLKRHRLQVWCGACVCAVTALAAAIVLTVIASVESGEQE